ncbi:16S rRNA (guanine(527)-N(7))-methyltransferase RsmG [Terriglobus sp. RCC_193]|uniref:16S rRNA (guanine(527)-N(7))-methyltransferase RsmG n=1 Tax=Terriglobus sp. RCC_193 TaxID=3239218 RepID=UPI0035240F6B
MLYVPSRDHIAALLAPYAESLPADTLEKLEIYLMLLLRWNQKTNLTAVRDPELLVQRQIGESLFAGRLLNGTETLLDFGSGAGFPGIPLKLLHPGLKVTLAESQGKKASFLREAVRTLGIDAEVWSNRVEAMPEGSVFDIVALRAVDHTEAMLPVAETRVKPKGAMLRYLPLEGAESLPGWALEYSLAVPLSQGCVSLWKAVESQNPGQ